MSIVSAHAVVGIVVVARAWPSRRGTMLEIATSFVVSSCLIVGAGGIAAFLQSRRAGRPGSAG
jgi:hypothetical protein